MTRPARNGFAMNGDTLKHEMDIRALAAHELAAEAGVCRSTLAKALKGLPVSHESARRIGLALNRNVEKPMLAKLVRR